MKTLSLIAEEYIAQAKELENLELPDEVVADTLESMSGELEAKAQAVAHVVRKLEAQAEAMKEWASNATENAHEVLNRARNLRDYLATTLQKCNIRKIEGPGISIGWRKSTSVDVYDPLQLPQAYWVPVPPKPDKKHIQTDINAGLEVAGAKLVFKDNLQIS